MQVPDNKEVANHVVPESCAAYREVRREALTGERTGQPWSRDRKDIPGADAVPRAEGNTDVRAHASARTTRRGRRPWHVRTLLAREPGDLGFDQSPYWAGPRREGRSRTPTMHGPEKSDSAIVATKPANKAAGAAAERVEPRVGTEGNTGQPPTRRTQSRVRVSQRLNRVRPAARPLGAAAHAVTHPR